MYTCWSPCASRSHPSPSFCPPSYHRASFYLDRQRCPSLLFPSFSIPLLLSRFPSRSLLFSSYTFSPYVCLDNSLSLHLIGASSHALPRVQPSAAHIRASWGGVVHHAVRPACSLPSLFLPSSPPLSSIPLSPAAIVHPNIVGEERIVTMARDQYDRTAHASVSLYLNPSPPRLSRSSARSVVVAPHPPASPPRTPSRQPPSPSLHLVR